MSALCAARAVADDLAETHEVVVWRPSSAVNGLAQAADGRLWAATPTGVFTSVGGPFEPAASPLGRTPARRVFTTSDGALWIATGEGQLAIEVERPFELEVTWRRGTPRLIERKAGVEQDRTAGLPDPWVWALAEAPDDAVWAGTERGLAVRTRDGGAWRAPTGEGPWPDLPVISMAFGEGDRLWLGTGDGVWAYRGGRRISVVGRGPVWDVVVAKGTGSPCVVALVAGELMLVEGPPPAPAAWASIDVRARALAADPRQGVWVKRAWMRGDRLPSGARVTGETEVVLERFVAGQPVERLRLPPEASAYAPELLRDREGSLWVGTVGAGLFQLRPRRLWHVGPAAGLPGETPFGVLAARDGSMWASATEGVARFGAGSPVVWRAGAELPLWAPRALAEGNDGTVYVAGDREGMATLRVTDGRASASKVDAAAALALPSGTREALVRTVAVDRDGGLWVGGAARLVHYPSGAPRGQPVVRTDRDGLCEGPITLVAFAPNKVLVASETGGLAVIESGGAVRCLRHGAGLPGELVLDALSAPDDQGAIWLTTDRPPGLHLVEGTRVRSLPMENAPMPRAPIVGLTDDGTGRLWLTTEDGVFSVPKQELRRALQAGDAAPAHVASWTLADGLPSAHCIARFQPMAAVDRFGRLWAPTLVGLSVIARPPTSGPALDPPLWERVLVDGRRTEVAGELALPAGVHTVELGARVPTFLTPKPVPIEYRVGPKGAWSRTADGSLLFAELEAGLHEVELRGIHGGVGPSPARRLRMVVARPWWRVPWVWVVPAALVFAGVVISQRLRLAWSERRLRFVIDERVRLARDLHDELGQGFASLGFLVDALSARLAGALPAAGQLLERMRVVLAHTRAGARRAIWDLRSEQAEGLSLEAALATAIESTARAAVTASGDPARVEVRIAGDVPARAPALAKELPLVVREAIVNATTHGGARSIDVSLSFADDVLTLVITDDGTGPDEDRRGGAGLVGLRERAARLGGILRVERATGGGGRVELVVPSSTWRASQPPSRGTGA